MEQNYQCTCVTPGEQSNWHATEIKVAAANADIARERAYAISGGAHITDVARVEE